MRLAALALLLLAGCATPGTETACRGGTLTATVTEAYFGRSLRDRAEVTDAEWDGFLREVVTPAFPDGLTALDGAGQWRRPDGTILRERSKLLILVLPGADTATARFLPAETVWKTRFGQQSVLTVHRPACVGF
ncbi:MAG: DUF3574 domain-containing protein [Alphaproteobacteria bacterium]|nr:DUF3574 domain-containing protein [Alphaproteobacteria bacterium]